MRDHILSLRLLYERMSQCDLLCLCAQARVAGQQTSSKLGRNRLHKSLKQLDVGLLLHQIPRSTNGFSKMLAFYVFFQFGADFS
ncbi:hypothetical protein ACM14_13650 [Delftia sp. JD2]|nr:hypothetical protein ACM14_13650 [Delftia sp. JD2]